ncbi:MAG: imm11 family protein [Hyalangium sp.]|uniref:imm11 family protein n=1 Tax=Hyalangium sp. TaxID=2028555 RepID=UPI003899CB7E
MASRFFALYDTVDLPGRWHLDDPIDSQGREMDDWLFKSGTPVSIKGGLRIPIEHAGRSLDFSETNLGIPVVHVRVASLFTELAPHDVQLIPSRIEGYPDQYLILVATRLIPCIDESTSRIRLWTREDGVPHKVGQYKSVRNMRIDPTRVGDARVFRPAGWEGTLIVSQEIKDALERLGTTGTKFEEV